MLLQHLLDQAVGFHGQGRLVDAERLYAQILQADPAHQAARHMLGVIRAQQERYKEARDLIGPVIQADPHDALALANYALVLNALGQYEEASQHFERSLAINPAHVEAWENQRQYPFDPVPLQGGAVGI